MKRLIDKNGRHINYLRLSITPRCNLKCIYCSRHSISDETNKRFLSIDEIERIVGIFQKLDSIKIRLTGGEPLLRSDIVELIKRLSKYPELDLFLTTNGVLLDKYAMDLKGAGLKRVNVSLDSLKDDIFKKITNGGELNKVLKGIFEAKTAGLNPIKLNVVILRGINDSEIKNLIRFAEENSLTIRFIEVMPIGLKHWEKYFVSNDEIIRRISNLIDYNYENISDGPARYYRLKSGTEIGFISPISHNFCKNCSRLRITSDGYLKTCLVSSNEYDLLRILREGKDDDEIINFIRSAILEKPIFGSYNDTFKSRAMLEIGG